VKRRSGSGLALAQKRTRIEKAAWNRKKKEVQIKPQISGNRL